MNIMGVGKHSITRQLIERVFALYCLVAIAVTVVQMTAEYSHTKQSIADELAINEGLFGSVLAQSLWDLDRDNMQSVLQGMLTVPAIVGVSLEQNDTVIAAVGEAVDDKGQRIEYVQKTTLESVKSKSSGDIFSLKFPVTHSYHGESRNLGYATVYSDSSVVIDRVGLNFIFLMINAVIKTLALWCIFLWFGKRYLNEPLTKLTEEMSSINFNNLDSFYSNLKLTQKNEFSVIEERFSLMISELKNAKKDLLDLNKDLEERVAERTADLSAAKEESDLANSSKSQFLSRMSHELRTPLNAIIGFSKRQEKLFGKRVDSGRVYDGDEQLAEMSTMVNKSGQHLLMLITDIMSFVQSEQGTININLQRCSLLDVISDSAIMVGPLADKHNVKVTFSCGNLWVWADPGRLMQVVINLMSNGIKYNKANGSVIVSVVKMSDEIVLNVTDTGVGISAVDSPSIFEPFVRLEHAKSNAIDGTGIGLALSQYLMSEMNGSIELFSEVDKGSTFSLHLREYIDEVAANES